MIDAAAQTGGAQLDPVYRAVYHVLFKDAEEHGRGKILSSSVCMLENNDDVNQLHRGETLLRYVSCTVDDIPYVLGKVLYRDMKTVSWTAVDSGKPIHVPKVATHSGVTLWNPNRREEVRIESFRIWDWRQICLAASKECSALVPVYFSLFSQILHFSELPLYAIGAAVVSWLVRWPPDSSPGRGHCVVFLGKTFYSHSASLHPGV